MDIHDAKTHLSRLIEAVARGEEIVIARSGKPAARLVAADYSPALRPCGLLQGKVWIPDDFDAPLPEEIVRAFDDSE